MRQETIQTVIAFVISVLSASAILAVYPLICWNRIGVLGAMIQLFVYAGLFSTLAKSQDFDPILFSFPFSIALPIALAVCGIRLFLGDFRQGDVQARDCPQFSILQIMIAMTVVAVIITIAKTWFSNIEFRRDKSEWYLILLPSATVFVFITLAGIWAIMSKFRIHRLVASIALCAVSIAATRIIHVAFESINWVVIFVVFTLVTWTQLTMLRVDGYRFVKRSFASRSPKSFQQSSPRS